MPAQAQKFLLPDETKENLEKHYKPGSINLSEPRSAADWENYLNRIYNDMLNRSKITHYTFNEDELNAAKGTKPGAVPANAPRELYDISIATKKAIDKVQEIAAANQKNVNNSDSANKQENNKKEKEKENENKKPLTPLQQAKKKAQEDLKHTQKEIKETKERLDKNSIKKYFAKPNKNIRIPGQELLTFLLWILLAKSPVSKKDGRKILKHFFKGEFKESFAHWARCVGNDPDAKNDLKYLQDKVEYLWQKLADLKDEQQKALDDKFGSNSANMNGLNNGDSSMQLNTANKSSMQLLSGENFSKKQVQIEEAEEEVRDELCEDVWNEYFSDTSEENFNKAINGFQDNLAFLIGEGDAAEFNKENAPSEKELHISSSAPGSF